MAHITIIPSDSILYVNGEARTVDLSSMDADIHAVQYNDSEGIGRIEFVNNEKPAETIGKTQFDTRFLRHIAAWRAAGEPPVRTLDEAKSDKRQQINSHRDTLEQSGFPYMGKTIDSNSVSVQRITVLVQSAQAAMTIGQEFSVDWTCQDNSVITLDLMGVLGMPPALASYANSLHQHAKDKKALIDAAATIDEVDAIVW